MVTGLAGVILFVNALDEALGDGFGDGDDVKGPVGTEGELRVEG